eukprot:g3099.t1
MTTLPPTVNVPTRILWIQGTHVTHKPSPLSSTGLSTLQRRTLPIRRLAVVNPQSAEWGKQRRRRKRSLRPVERIVQPVHRREVNERGEQGYRKTTVIQKSVDLNTGPQWEEIWWDASDWNDYRELGAKKSCTESNRMWNEQWIEKLYFDISLHSHVSFKTCKKWCKVQNKDFEEWEEEWEETFVKNGQNTRWSKKWGQRGALIWHENWGDDIDAEGNGKLWTDKWYENMIENEGHIQWGEKWEAILQDKYELSRTGESWRKAAQNYNRWWSEHKSPKDLTVTKTGHSTTGEYWNVIEKLTEYDFLPVINTNRYELAVASSPQLLSVEIASKI